MTEYCILKSYNFSGDPFEVFQLFKEEPHAFFLDSSINNTIRGRYSFIGFDPFAIFSDKGKNSLCDLRALYKSYKKTTDEVPTPFPAGMMGYFSYDFGMQLEKISLRSFDDLLLPDCFFGFYDCILTIDHLAQKLYLTSTGLPERSGHLAKKRAHSRMAYIIKRLKEHNPCSSVGTCDGPSILEDSTDIIHSSNFTRQEYLEAVRKALKYIAEGDIYQVNLSQRFSFDLGRNSESIDLTGIYRRLRRLSPSSFSGYFNCGDFQVISNSPERFISLQGNIAQTRPMKGTRPRGRNKSEDAKFKEDLMGSHKDKAELLMITDLLRNDLGRVCRYGSIQVKEMRTLEEYATVFQTTSTVEGVLLDNRDGFDLIAACYPGGSITGCPKIRAMEIIEELEPTRRGLYTGSMGYFSISGSMDFNILIRTMLATKGKMHFQAGGGIVADSTPEHEYQETLIKAEALRRSLVRTNFLRAEV